MFLLVSKMAPADGALALTDKQKQLIDRCCKKQASCLVGAGQTLEECAKSVCTYIWKEQLPCIAAMADCEFEIPANACIVDLIRINDVACTAGFFPDDFIDKGFHIGSFYLDGSKV